MTARPCRCLWGTGDRPSVTDLWNSDGDFCCTSGALTALNNKEVGLLSSLDGLCIHASKIEALNESGKR